MAIKHREDKEVNENRASVTVNIAHLDLPSVDVGDLLTIPVTVDPLPIDPFAQIDNYKNDHCPIDLLPDGLNDGFQTMF